MSGLRLTLLLIAAYAALPLVAFPLVRWEESRNRQAVTLLNVSYDPTRELWRDVNRLFVRDHERRTGQRVAIRQSHGGSGSQARSVLDGLPADVVTLALWSDTDALRAGGLLAEHWDERLPNKSLPYTSTIVFVVRAGNPKGISDWPHLVRPGVEVITPNPKTSGNGKLSFLAAWGSVSAADGSGADAEQFVAELYRHVPVLDTGARGSATTFQNGIGDVHLTWENEAYQEVQESRSKLEVVYPPRSIRAEPPVAVVDRVTEARGTRAVAEEYLRFLYTEPAQEVLAKHHFRPSHPAVAARVRFPPLELFGIDTIAPGWAAAQQRFFDAGGVFDRLAAAPRGKTP